MRHHVQRAFVRTRISCWEAEGLFLFEAKLVRAVQQVPRMGKVVIELETAGVY